MDLCMYKSFSVVPICVTKVTSSFENFKFAVWLNPLNISSVEAEIVHTLWSALTFKADYYPVFSFWVHAVFRWWSSKSSSQIAPTLHTCVCACTIQLNTPCCWRMMRFSGSAFHVWLRRETFTLWMPINPIHVTLLDRVDFIGLASFFAFPASLTKHEVAMCLCDFIMMTATALNVLHCLNFAHLDVKIPNICFSQRMANTSWN